MSQDKKRRTKSKILLKHLNQEDLSCRGEPLQTFNTQSSATGAPGTRLGIAAHHSPEGAVVNCFRNDLPDPLKDCSANQFPALCKPHLWQTFNV